MSKQKTWAPPGWPWELDVLALVFVILALAVPYIMHLGEPVATGASANPVAPVLREQQNVLWAIGIVVLFIMHLALAGASLETISTPFIHLISPLAFALIAYYRILMAAQHAGKSNLITGSPAQMVVLGLAVVAATLLVARIRMARYLLRFRDIKWDLVSRARYDSTYFELAAQFRPLVYPPRLYRACTEGLLIEGWFYIMPVSFAMVQSLSAVNGVGYASSGKYHASSSASLIRLELLDNSEPLYISPSEREEFLRYCAQHVSRLRPTVTRTPPKTRPGTHTSPGTPNHHTNAGIGKG